MRTSSIIILGALCASAAIAQTKEEPVSAKVAAQKASKNAAKLMDCLTGMLKLQAKYCDIIDQVEAKKVSPLGAAKQMDKLIAEAHKLKAEMKEIVDNFTEADKDAMGKITSSEQLNKMMDDAIKRTAAADGKLKATNYFGSPELKAACEKIRDM